MDTNLFNNYYNTCGKKFTAAARSVSQKEHLGNWPIPRKVSRTMFAYMWVLSQVKLGAVVLTDKQIMTIVTRINEIKYV